MGAPLPLQRLTQQSCMHIGQLIATYNEKDISIDRSDSFGCAARWGARAGHHSPGLPCEHGLNDHPQAQHDRQDSDELEAGGAFAQVEDASDGLRPFEVELLELKKQRRIREFLHRVVLEKRNLADRRQNRIRQDHPDPQPDSLHPEDRTPRDHRRMLTNCSWTMFRTRCTCSMHARTRAWVKSHRKTVPGLLPAHEARSHLAGRAPGR